MKKSHTTGRLYFAINRFKFALGFRVITKPKHSAASYMRRSLWFCAVLCGFISSQSVNALPLNELRQITENFPSFTFVGFGDAQLTPDGKYIVFNADLNSDNLNELFSVPINGGEITRLNPDLVDDGDVTDFQITPDSQHVVYRANQDANDIFELFRVPITGGTSARLNPSFQEPGLLDRDVGNDFQISPDGAFVLYEADLRVADQEELLRVPIEGGISESLSGPVVSGGSVNSVKISPDGSMVIYGADQFIDNVFELFSVPINGDGDDVTRLHPPLGGIQDAFSPEFTPDGKRVVFRLNVERASRRELFSAAVNGDDSAALVPLIPGFPRQTGDVSSFQISPDGLRVVYEADQRIDSATELFVAAIEGGVPTFRISAELPSFGDVRDFKISPSGARVLYTADAFLSGIDKLFSVSIDGDGSNAIPIESDTLNVDDVTDFVISGDGRQVIFEKRFDIDETIQLFRAPITGGEEPVSFSPVFGDPDENEESVLLEAFNDGQLVLFVPPDGRRIFAARIALAVDDSEMCFPIVAADNKVAVICL
jgi:Tol biopolymer transport system component